MNIIHAHFIIIPCCVKSSKYPHIDTGFQVRFVSKFFIIMILTHNPMINVSNHLSKYYLTQIYIHSCVKSLKNDEIDTRQ